MNKRFPIPLLLHRSVILRHEGSMFHIFKNLDSSFVRMTSSILFYLLSYIVHSILRCIERRLGELHIHPRYKISLHAARSESGDEEVVSISGVPP